MHGWTPTLKTREQLSLKQHPTRTRPARCSNVRPRLARSAEAAGVATPPHRVAIFSSFRPRALVWSTVRQQHDRCRSSAMRASIRGMRFAATALTCNAVCLGFATGLAKAPSRGSGQTSPLRAATSTIGRGRGIAAAPAFVERQARRAREADMTAGARRFLSVFRGAAGATSVEAGPISAGEGVAQQVGRMLVLGGHGNPHLATCFVSPVPGLAAAAAISLKAYES